MSNNPRSPESPSSSGGRCRALVESGSLCGEPTDFKIIEEFNRLYCERLDIAESSGRQELVVRTLKEWVNDLNEANNALVDTIKKLEAVALSSSALCNKSNAEKTDESEKLNKELNEKEKKINCLEKKVKELNELLSEKECKILKINCELEDMKKCLESQEKQAKDKVEYLERRVDDLKSRNETYMNNASHCEKELRLKEEEIFDLQLKLADYSKPAKTSKPVQSIHKEILDKLSEKEKQLSSTEKKLQNACEEICELQSRLYDKTNELEMSGKIVCCATIQKPGQIHNNYSKGRNSDSTVVTNAVEQSRLKRIGELENCLDDANDKISHLKKEIQEKEHEIAQINFMEVSRTNITDASLSSKFDEFQRFIDECSAKLKQILLCFKQYPQTEQLFQDIEDYKKHLLIEEGSLNRMFKMLDEIKNEVKSSHKVKNCEENATVQSLKQIISSVIELLQKENEKEKFPSKKEKCPIDNAITLLCNAIALKEDVRKISPQTSPINDTCSRTTVSFLIEKVITEMNRALNETKYQKEKLIASEENQITDFSTFTNSLKTLEQHICLYNSAIEKMKQEIKIVMCKTNKKGEQLKKQCEKLEVLGCLIQEIKCFVDKSDPVNSYKLSGKINKLERNYFDAMAMKRSSEKKNECTRNKKYFSSQRECSSTPQLGQPDSDSELFHEGSFQDKSNIAQVLFYEIKKELELGGEIICEREKELNRLENKILSFRSCSINISKELDCLKNCLFTENFDLKQIIFRTEEIHQRLNAGIESLCRMLHSYDKERQKYEMHNTHFKWKVQVKLRELAETVDDLSLKLGELREINLRKFQRQFSSTGWTEVSDISCNQLSPLEIQEVNEMRYMMSSTLQEGNISTMKETIMQQEDMIKTLNSELENSKKEMEHRIKKISSEKEKCEIKSQDAIKELQSKICQLQESMQQSSKDPEANVNNILCGQNQNELELKYIICDLNKKLEDKNEQLLKQEKQICDMEGQLKELNRSLIELEENLLDKNKDEQTYLMVKDEEKENLKIELTSKCNRIKALYEENNKLERDLCQLKSANKILDDNVYFLKQKILLHGEEKELLQDKINSLNCQLKLIENDKSCFSIDDDEENVTTLKEDMQLVQDNYHSLLNERENLLEENKQMCASLKLLSEEVNSLNKDKEFSEKLSSECIALKNEIETLTLKMKKLQEQNVCLSHEYIDYKQCCEKVQEDLIDKNNYLNDKLNCLRKKYNDLCDVHEQENICLNNRIAEFQKKIKELEQEVRETEKLKYESELIVEETKHLLKEKMKTWTIKYKEKCSEVIELNNHVEALKNALLTNDHKMLERNESCNATRKKIEYLTNQLADKDYEIMYLHKELKKAVSENLQLEESLCKAEEKLQSMSKCLCFLETEKQKIKLEYCRLKDTLTNYQSSGGSSARNSQKKDSDSICKFPIELDCDKIGETFEDNKKIICMVKDLQATNMSMLRDLQNFVKEAS